jgi:hypothetical protein
MFSFTLQIFRNVDFSCLSLYVYVRLGAAKVEVSHLDSCYDILTLVLSKDIQGIVSRIHMYILL